MLLQKVYYDKLPGKNPTGLLYQEYNRTRTSKSIKQSMTTTEPISQQDIDDILTGNFLRSLIDRIQDLKCFFKTFMRIS